MQEFDDELLDVLDLEANDIGHLRFPPQIIDDPSKTSRPPSANNFLADQVAEDDVIDNPSPLIKLESITETVEDSVGDANDPEKKQRTLPKKIDIDELINSAFKEEEKQKMSR